MSDQYTAAICWFGIASLCAISLVRIGYRGTRDPAGEYKRLLPFKESIMLFPVPFLVTFVYNVLALLFLEGDYKIALAVVFSIISFIYVVFFIAVYRRLDHLYTDHTSGSLGAEGGAETKINEGDVKRKKRKTDKKKKKKVSETPTADELDV